MFDTPDLGPCFLAPFIAVVVGVFVYASSSAIGDIIEKKSGRKPDSLRQVTPILAIVIAPILCIASVFLGIGARDPAPWFKPSEASVVGTYQLNPNDHYGFKLPAHELVFSDDGTFAMNKVPTLWDLTSEWDIMQMNYIDVSGVWHIDEDHSLNQREWAIIAQLNKVNGKADSRVMRFYFEGHLPPYMLIYLDKGIFRFVRN